MSFEMHNSVTGYSYHIEADKITIFNKKKAIIYSGNISDIVLLCFVEKNLFGAGQLVLSLPNSDKVFLDGFRDKDRAKYLELYNILKEKTSFLDLSYVRAIKYLKPEKIKEKENDKINNRRAEENKKQHEEHSKHLRSIGFKLIEETKCVCSRCNEIWYIGNESKAEKLDNFANKMISLGSYMQGKTLTGTYHQQLAKDNSKCPKCGSNAFTKTKQKYWLNDKTGDVIEYEKNE